mmetsp:Transcript_16190/g.21280  ORF Transcript_16190/g.21280 Transcript_16190/m.21280 type:complete len:309 (+) Transcript_16190:64-990(+)
MPGFQRRRNAVQLKDRVSDPDPKQEGRNRFAVVFGYDGTDFQGFQSQPHGNTIQDAIEYRLQRFLQRKLRIFSSGRTDCGVHAREAVFHVDLLDSEVKKLESYNNGSAGDVLLSTLRRGFPAKTFAIMASAVCSVPSDFDARFSCKQKQYVYTIACGYVSPFSARYVWQVPEPLDLEQIKQAARLLQGKRDFGWLAVSLPGESRNTVRDLQIDVEYKNHCDSARVPIIKVICKCDFFLYKMVRRTVGLLVNIGRQKVTIEELKQVLKLSETKQEQSIPSHMLHTAPPFGLCLEKVTYDFDLHASVQSS